MLLIRGHAVTLCFGQFYLQQELTQTVGLNIPNKGCSVSVNTLCLSVYWRNADSAWRQFNYNRVCMTVTGCFSGCSHPACHGLINTVQHNLYWYKARCRCNKEQFRIVPLNILNFQNKETMFSSWIHLRMPLNGHQMKKYDVCHSSWQRPLDS